MRPPLPSSLPCLASLLALVLGVACADGGDGQSEPADSSALVTSDCAIGVLIAEQFSSWPDGSDAELVVGYQGYLFVHVQVADKSGELLKPNVRMTAECDGLEPSVTTRWRADMSPAGDGSTVSELLEVWLFPALRESFIDKKGRITVELQERGQVCKAEVNIHYVDELLCMHYEDGSIKCKD